MRIPTLIRLSLVLSFVACNSTQDEAPVTIGDGSGLPQIYWTVELAGVDVLNPASYDDHSFVRLFDDGRIVTPMANDPTGKLQLRSPSTGEWSYIEPPAGQTGAAITWYEDESNLGGYYSEAPSHGFVMVDGVVHTFFGPPGMVRGRLPDGSFLLDSYAGGYRFFQKWTFGSTLVDELDIHDYFYEDMSKGRMFSRLAEDGTFLLVQTGNGDARQIVIKDGVEIPIGFEYFNRVEPLDPDREGIVPCCRILTIDRIRGGIFGIKNGKPVIKIGSEYDKVSDEKGEPVALNGNGDAIYTTVDTKVFHSPRIRLDGKLYQFALSDWASLSRYEFNSTSTGLPIVLDMNSSGQVIFVVQGTTAGQAGFRLFLATPSLKAPEPTVYAHLAFTVKSGPGKALDPIDLASPFGVTGAFSDGNLTISVTAPSKEAGKSKSFFALINASAQSPFAIDSPIPVKTTVVGTSLVTASVSYSDPAVAFSAVAGAGSLRVKSQSQYGGFTVAFEDIQFTAKDGTVYLLNGDATIP